MNKVYQLGRLTKDVSLSETKAGTPIALFTIAVQRPYPSVNGHETDFFNCVAFRTIAENCSQYLRKGSQVFIAGYLQNRTVENRDGTKRVVTEIVIEEVHFLDYGIKQPQNENAGEITPKTNDELKQLVREQIKLETVSGKDLPF